MERLSGIEGAFYYRENDTNNSQIGFLFRLRRPVSAPPITLDALRQQVMDRLDLLPSFRWILRRVPLELHRPVIIDNPNLDIAALVTEVTIEDEDPVPKIGPMMMERLDLGRSTWRMVLMHQPSGAQALLLVAHHIIMDGVAFFTTSTLLFSDDLSDEVLAQATPPQRETLTRWRLLTGAVAEQMRDLWAAPGVIRRIRKGQRALAARLAESDELVAERRPLSPNYRLTAERRTAGSVLSLTDVRWVAKAAEVTVNAVLLEVIGHSLRGYLSRHDLVPDHPIATAVMASTDSSTEARQSGNRIDNYVMPIRSRIDDLWADLQLVSANAAEAKQRMVLRGAGMLDEAADLIPPPITKVMLRRRHRRALRGPVRMRSSLLYSNIWGPLPETILGSNLAEVFTFGPVNDFTGVFLVSTNVGDKVCLAVGANPTALEFPDELAAAFPQTLAELVALASAHRDLGTV